MDKGRESEERGKKLYEPEQVDEKRAVVIADGAGPLQGVLGGKHWRRT